MKELKTPPHSVEAEQAMIGGLFLGGDFDDICETIKPSDFYRNDHKLIFAAIVELAANDKPYDLVTVSEQLELSHELENAGGLAYLAGIADNTPSYANLKAYAEIVRKRALLRGVIKVSQEVTEACFDPQGKTAEEVADIACQKIFALTDTQNNSTIRSSQDVIADTLDAIDLRFRNDGLLGISTGLDDLDTCTQGLCNQDLIIIAGRPSMGKSALAFGISAHVALSENKKVLNFSMEMSGDQVISRLLSKYTHVPFEALRTGKLNDNQWPLITEQSGRMSQAEFYVDESPALTPAYVRSRARKHAKRYGLDLIVIDYLQLMRCHAERRDLEISEITGQMKAMAKELNVPVILLSQLNRSLESRTNKRPVMADLRDGGSIEQDADMIIFVYRDEVYNPDSPNKGRADLIIAKQRNGAIGEVPATFLSKYVSFENYIQEWRSNAA